MTSVVEIILISVGIGVLALFLILVFLHLIGWKSEDEPPKGETIGVTRYELDLIKKLRQLPEFVPPIQWSDSEANAWADFISSPVGRKLDICMFDFYVQQQGRALWKKEGEQLDALRIAAGAWQGWAVAKSFSRVSGRAQSEDDSEDGVNSEAKP